MLLLNFASKCQHWMEIPLAFSGTWVEEKENQSWCWKRNLLRDGCSKMQRKCFRCKPFIHDGARCHCMNSEWSDRKCQSYVAGLSWPLRTTGSQLFHGVPPNTYGCLNARGKTVIHVKYVGVLVHGRRRRTEKKKFHGVSIKSKTEITVVRLL